MKIIIDGMGGDNAPAEVLKGAALAVAEYDVDMIITGDEEKIRAVAAQENISLNRIEIADAKQIITMEDDPGEIMKSKKDCSMAKGLQLLAAGEGEAFVSAGNTGALVFGSTFLIKRIKGVKRPALAPILPHDKGNYMLLDGGANVECRPEMLQSFGVMGSVYMEKVLGIAQPRVGLANIGTEECKGGELQQQTYQLLKKAPLHFIGNAEARDIPAGICDVVVADVFTGIIILMLTEGLGLTLVGNIKQIFKKNLLTKLAAVFTMKGLKEFKKKMDYTEHGGAPLMGVRKPVIKAHGSSNAKAFKNAIRQAKSFVSTGVIEEIEERLSAPSRE